MSANILNTIQQNLGNPELKKIDPNTQHAIEDGKTEDKLNQAAIPAVLISMYKYSRSDEGAENIMTLGITNDWMKIFLEDKSAEAINKVAEYAGVTNTTAQERMELIAKQAVGLVRESNPASLNDVKNTIAAEKPKILTYLPASLDMGKLLNDNTLDDKVNKMEGPISNLMHTVGEIFSQSEKSEKK